MRVRKIFVAAPLFTALFLSGAQRVHAGVISTLFSTGVDASGNPLPDASIDPHYTLNPGNVFVIGNPGGVGWINNTATSSWVSADASTFAGGGPFTYHTTFDLTGLNPGTAVITGTLSADDQASIFLNGVDVFDGLPTGAAPWAQYEPFTISTNFVNGINSLDIVVPNNINSPDDGPTGVQLNLSGTASPSPEPASLALFALGIGALAWVKRKAYAGPQDARED